MHLRSSLKIIFVVMLLLAASLFLSLQWLKSGQNGHSLNAPIVERPLLPGISPSTYTLVPESKMTGLCWRSGDGSRQGVFKDVNNGIAQWQEKPPALPSRQRAADYYSKNGHNPDHEQLLHHLRRLSFNITESSFTGRRAEITGILTIAGQSQQITLEVDMPGGQRIARQDQIEINASRAIRLYESVPELSAGRRNIDLCLSIQAVSSRVGQTFVAQQIL